MFKIDGKKIDILFYCEWIVMFMSDVNVNEMGVVSFLLNLKSK